MQLIPQYRTSSISIDSRSYRIFLLLVVLVSAAMQWFYFQPKVNTDAQIWLNIGRDLGRSGELAYPLFYYERVFFAGFLKLWQMAVEPTETNVLILLILLSSASIILVAEIARVAAGHLAGLTAAGLFAWHPIVLIFSTFLVSDVLVVPLSLGSLLLATHYLRTEKVRFVAGAAFLGGTCFFVKSYISGFGLAAILVYLLATWSRSGPKLRTVIALIGSFLLPIVIGHLLHWLLHGDAFFYLGYFKEYASRVYGDTGLTLNQLFGIEGLKVANERSVYLADLYWDAGIFASVWSIFASIYLIVRVRSSFFHLLLGSLFVGLFLFLLIAPARLSPLVFVEIQTRYLIIPVALLAIGAGVALADYTQEVRARLRLEAALALVVVAMTSFAVPELLADKYFSRYRVLDHFAFQSALQRLNARDHASLLVPVRYESMFPDELRHLGPTVEFIDTHGETSVEASLERIRGSHAPTSVYIPRRQYPALAENIRIAPMAEVQEYDESARLLAARLETEGFRRQPVHVPYSPIRLFMMRQGVQTKGELVGWVFSNEEAFAKEGAAR